MASLKKFLDTIAPEPPVLAAIRAESKKNGTDKLTVREIDREILAYRKERKAKDYVFQVGTHESASPGK